MLNRFTEFLATSSLMVDQMYHQKMAEFNLDTAANVTSQQSLELQHPELQMAGIEEPAYTDPVVEEAVSNGTISTPINQVRANYNKYSSLLTKPTKPEVSAQESMLQYLFGKPEMTKFETLKNNFISRAENPHQYRLGQAASKKLNTLDGLTWTGALYMGSENESLDVIFDTASDWLTIEGKSCTTCEGNTFDVGASTSAKAVGGDLSQRTYGSQKFLGLEYTDQVCVTLQACIDSFEFFLIEQQEGSLREPVDGFLGLARNKAQYLGGSTKVTRGPSFMMALENAGLISQNTFSFDIYPFGQESSMDFGAPDTSKMRDPQELQYIEVLDDFFWSANCKGFALGSVDNGWQWGAIKDQDATVANGEVYSVFDSSSTSIIFPQDYFEQFMNEMYGMMAGKEYEVTEGYVVTKCYDDFPTLYFLFGDKWVGVDPSEYVTDVSDLQDRSMCILLLSQGASPFIVMGLPLYVDYYTVHDDTNNRIGFAPNSGSSKGGLVTGTQPSRKFESTSPEDPEVSIWSWVISGLLVMAFMVLWLFIIASTFRKQSQTNALLMLGVGCLFIILFAVIVYWKLQPIINDLIVGAPVTRRLSDRQMLVEGQMEQLAKYTLGMATALLFIASATSKKSVQPSEF